ncbi:hypothetical protein F5Y18DRAFT_187870 [Xylariaceae sp. FL1019]|nr:hypothetical protein F5Y18DRAFT_187870 [Xylariaceae sp. FL1019]
MESFNHPAATVKSPDEATATQTSAGRKHLDTSMGPRVFHLYPNLPTELKAMVWDFAFLGLFPGAHCFKLSTGRGNGGMIVVKPDNDRKGDPSAWRQINYLFRACDIRDFFQKRLVERGLTLYQDSFSRHRVKTEENGIRANVSGQDDLIRFKFNYGDSHASISMVESIHHQPAFSGITRVGVELEQVLCFLSSNRQPKYRPFRCLCVALGQARNHIQLGPSVYVAPNFICCGAIIRFACLFKDLKSFYIIVNLKDYRLRYTTLNIPRSKMLHKVNSNGLSTQLALDVFVHHNGMCPVTCIWCPYSHVVMQRSRRLRAEMSFTTDAGLTARLKPLRQKTRLSPVWVLVSMRTIRSISLSRRYVRCGLKSDCEDIIYPPSSSRPWPSAIFAMLKDLTASDLISQNGIRA